MGVVTCLLVYGLSGTELCLGLGVFNVDLRVQYSILIIGYPMQSRLFQLSSLESILVLWDLKLIASEIAWSITRLHDLYFSK